MSKKNKKVILGLKAEHHMRMLFQDEMFTYLKSASAMEAKIEVLDVKTTNIKKEQIFKISKLLTVANKDYYVVVGKIPETASTEDFIFFENDFKIIKEK